MRATMVKWVWVLATGVFMTASEVLAEPIETINLKEFVGPSPFDRVGAPSLLPRGRQVLDGVPFQVDGIITLYGSNAAQRSNPGKTNVTGIPVARKFDRLHLLAAGHSSATDKAVIATVNLEYADGSHSELEVRYGDHVRNWFGPWHKAEKPMSAETRQAWVAQNSVAAASDDYARLFHVTLANPSPEKEVKTVSLVSARKAAALMVAALSVGSGTIEKLPDTIPLPKSPFPDLRKRTGEPLPLTGTVQSVDGKPLSGARVRVMGTRSLGTGNGEDFENDPSVGNEATTDAQGRFELPAVPDNRLYRVAAGAEGFEAAVYAGADPKSEPVEIRLTPLSAAALAGKNVARARVTGPDDQPLAWAFLEPYGVSEAYGSSTWGGSSMGFPEQLMTGTNGEVAVTRTQAFIRVQVIITAKGLAPKRTWLAVTNTIQTVKLGEGGTVRGRVVKEGKPVAGVRVGVVSSQRSMDEDAGRFEAKTGNDGVFVFEHLPADVPWNFFGYMKSLKPYGAIKLRPVRTGANKETVEMGDVEVVPGLHVAGKLKTRTGEPAPKGAKLALRQEDAWDSLDANVDADGNFRFDGVPPGEMSVFFQQRGWRMAGGNRSVDMWNPYQLVGRVEQDKDDLEILIERGETQYGGSSGNGQLPSPDWPQNRPISGVETSGPPFIVLGGKVVDDKTGQPVAACRVVPGYQPPIAARAPGTMLQQALKPFAGNKKVVNWNELPYWQMSRAETITNGIFALEFVSLISQPIFRIEARGYQPYESEPSAEWITNLVIRLKRGAGPNGVVLLPDGKPAGKVTVIYAAEHEQSGLTGRNLNSYTRQDSLTTTDADGKFSFIARAQGMKLFVANEQGWADESVEHGAGDGIKLRLKPWACLSGTLVDSNGVAMPNVLLGLTMQSDWSSGLPYVHYNCRTNTDAQGRFFFPDVPPRRMELQRIIPMGGNAWTWKLQTWFVAQPGITNDLGKVTYDTPPPPSALEQLKRKIGL